MAPRAAPRASLAGLASLDSLDDLPASSEFIEQELVVKIIDGLREEMLGCSNAFFGVALASVALSVVAASGVEVSEAPEVLFSGVTVGDVATWMDSLLVAGLLRYGAESFGRVLDTGNERKQLAYTFQGINRLGMVFQQLAVAAGTVSFVITLEAAVEWPPLVTVASGLFFAAAVARSMAMWRCVEAANDVSFPLLDRLAIRIAFNYLLQYEAAGRRPSEQASGAQPPAATGAAAASALPAAALGVPAGSAGPGGAALRGSSVQEILRGLPPVLPLISRPGRGSDGGDGGARGEGPGYELTPEEERLVQAFQSSLNSAGLSLVLQSFATGLLVTAGLASNHIGDAIADGIQVVNKAIAAELIFVATANIDNALYTDGCDVAHLLQGLGKNGLTKLFHNLSILAWAVVMAKLVALAAPWEESSPFFSYLNEVLGHKAGDFMLEAEQMLVKMLP
ncbi:hypothetical protein MNEG_6274 [Monoraphidium neglectum]|uniref:Uncharacterized protein n=1 Tax=Monoraphidium neglectum TaxID=145388 RepID=A0A0D2N771_9CHLO|nr:hypothetical protein MNEG_6274 [Monoraphidium neglectum]KIZ01686.1 hypothetical protein MNEG_6274 [Monoraphidium neglectum]|eukprot:XP_013900705.1 hypothetical protein MNEG_6274 [Monoraphidium neglectum]